jgi:hypothetical protein
VGAHRADALADAAQLRPDLVVAAGFGEAAVEVLVEEDEVRVGLEPLRAAADPLGAQVLQRRLKSSSAQRSSYSSRTERAVGFATRKPPSGCRSRKCSAASRSSASRTGVRETPSCSAIRSSASRIPSGIRPSRIHALSAP